MKFVKKYTKKNQLKGLLLIDFWILSLFKAEENYLDLQNIMGNLLQIMTYIKLRPQDLN